MKHKNMVPLMGKIVTVRKRLIRREIRIEGSLFTLKWISVKCRSWGGWIVGFTYKQDGKLSIPGDYEESSSFNEISRQLCVLVKKWPTMSPTPVPLDGYTIGGLPVSPSCEPLPEGEIK